MNRDEAQEFWEIVIQKIQQRLSKPMYDTWIAPLSGQIAVDNTIIIRAASEFAADWIKERYKHDFIDVLKGLTGLDFKVQVTYEEKKVERSASDHLLSEVEVINKNDDYNNKVKFKKASVGAPIIPPSYSTMELRRVNEKITRSLNLPLADSGLSNAEKRLYKENQRIRKKLQCQENGKFGLFFR